MVSLGRDRPSWELNRWGRDSLRFSPFYGGAYSLRGDRNTLHYAGKKQSHRFTILDNEHFEYDIILNAEPESNRFYLAIEGWEVFDFFRQPDTFGPEILRGSYAVYKKEGVINSPTYHVGTGKICHIHRPKIIDARGRWTWGDIFIDQGVMTLTVPEGWLGEAAYPVVVDPVIGSNTIGVYETYDYIAAEDYAEYLADKKADSSTNIADYSEKYILEFDWTWIFNKYKTSLQLSGTYNTYVYLGWIPSHGYNYNVYSILYSDYYNKPKNLLTYNCTPGNPLANLPNAGSFTPRWVKSTLTTYGTIAANTDVWFGYWAQSGSTRFDYGVPLFQTWDAELPIDDMGDYNSLIDMCDDYDLYDISYCTDNYSSTNSGHPPNVYPGSRYDMKASMYLEINANAYTRTLTQGVKLSDTRRTISDYKKTLVIHSGNISALGHGAEYTRTQTATVHGTALTFHVGAILRNLADFVGLNDTAGRWGDYLRGLLVEVGCLAETDRSGEYQREASDVAAVGGVSLGGIGYFIKLVTVGLVRDFIVRRFLKSNEELVIKSPVCRIIEIDSRIH